MGYVDGMGLYAFARLAPVVRADAFGTASQACTPYPNGSLLPHCCKIESPANLTNCMGCCAATPTPQGYPGSWAADCCIECGASSVCACVNSTLAGCKTCCKVQRDEQQCEYECKLRFPQSDYAVCTTERQQLREGESCNGHPAESHSSCLTRPTQECLKCKGPCTGGFKKVTEQVGSCLVQHEVCQ